MTLIRTTILIFGMQLTRSLRSKRTGFCLLVAIGPGALAWLIQRFPGAPPSVEIVIYPGWFLLLQVIVPILSLIAGSAVISEEIDDRTVTYLFTRPIPRAALMLGRWLATALVLCLILAFGAGLLALMARFGGNPPERAHIGQGVVGPLIAMAVLGGAVYSGLFAAIGTLYKHPMIVGLGYTFAIEGFLANLPGKSQGLTIQFYLRSYIAGRGAEVWQRIESFELTTFDPAGEALATLLWVLVVALAVGCVVVSRRQYLLTA